MLTMDGVGSTEPTNDRVHLNDAAGLGGTWNPALPAALARLGLRGTLTDSPRHVSCSVAPRSRGRSISAIKVDRTGNFAARLSSYSGFRQRARISTSYSECLEYQDRYMLDVGRPWLFTSAASCQAKTAQTSRRS
jgi:hypothetical protein